MVRMVNAILLAALCACLTGCRQDPESAKREIAAKINAASLYELAMKDKLQAYAHIPGMSQSLAAEYEEFCRDYRLPLEESFEKLMKKGFPALETTVQQETLKQGVNSFEKDDILYLVTFKADAKSEKGISYIAVLQFVVYASPEGVGVIKAGGYDQLNGVKTPLKSPYSVMLRVVGISRGMDKLLELFAKQQDKNVKE